MEVTHCTAPVELGESESDFLTNIYILARYSMYVCMYVCIYVYICMYVCMRQSGSIFLRSPAGAAEFNWLARVDLPKRIFTLSTLLYLCLKRKTRVLLSDWFGFVSSACGCSEPTVLYCTVP